MKRKKSKISIQIEEYKNSKKEKVHFIEEIKEDEIDNDLIDIDNNDFENNVYSSKYIVNNNKQFLIYFYLEIFQKEFIIPIESDFFDIKKQYMYELIKNIIKIINNKKYIILNNSIKYIVSLKDSEEDNDINFYSNNFKLKRCNSKTLKPTNDFLNYSSSSLLEVITEDKISFICKNPLNIMLTEKYDDNKENNEHNVLCNDILYKKLENSNYIYDTNNNISNYKEGLCKSICLIM